MVGARSPVVIPVVIFKDANDFQRLALVMMIDHVCVSILIFLERLEIGPDMKLKPVLQRQVGLLVLQIDGRVALSLRAVVFIDFPPLLRAEEIFSVFCEALLVVVLGLVLA